MPLVLYKALFGSSRSTTLYSGSKTVATYICSSYTVTYYLFECVIQLRIILYRRAPEFAFRPLHEPLRTPWLLFSVLFNITTIMRSSIRHSTNTNTTTLHATKPQKYQQFNPKSAKNTFTKKQIYITPNPAIHLDHNPSLMI